MLATFLREKYRNPNTNLSDYVTYYLARVKNDVKINIGFEVLDAKFYNINDLPELATKATKEELMIAYNVLKNNLDVYFD